MNEKEVWRLSFTLPDAMASSWGRLMRIPHWQGMPHGGHRWYGGEPTYGVWEPTQSRFIYPYKGKTFRVARIICEAFHGLPSDDKPICIHIDEDSRHNWATNLRWGTQKENLNAPGFIAYCKSRTGENNPLIKGRLLGDSE